jgi:hypothetical protein
VGGLILDLVGRVPDAGDSVEVDGFRLTALDVRGRRIGRVRIEPTGTRDGGAASVSASGEGEGGDGDVTRAERAGDTSHSGG